MNVYIYAAALLCEACGEAQRKLIVETDPSCVPTDPDDETSYDSDDFPKGPQDEGESDTPSHCDQCNAFLESRLTSEGETYVREAIERAYIEGKNPSESIALCEWRGYYGIEPEDPRAVRLARMNVSMREQADPKTGELDAYAWPGGYPVFYVTSDDEVACVKCANDPSTGVDAFGCDVKIVAGDVNWEDPDLYCECGERIESAYAEPEDDDKTSESEAP